MAETNGLSSVNSAQITEAAQLLASIVSTLAPNVKCTPGTVLYDLVLRLAGAMHVYESANLATMADTWNLASVTADPAAVDSSVVDLLLSNFNIARTTGATATGAIEVILSSNVPTIISSGAVFTTSSGMEFRPISTVTAITTARADNEQAFVERADGNYSVTVAAQAAMSGSAYNVASGTLFSMTPSAGQFVSAVAATNFAGGTDTQSNASILSTISTNLPAKILSGRQNAVSLLKQLLTDTYASVSCIGMYDPEMIRDQRGALGNPIGGRVDVYTRTQGTLENVALSKTGTSISNTTHASLVFVPSDISGCYFVDSVMYGDTVIPIISQTWGVSTTTASSPHDIVTVTENGFSSYQTLTLVVDDSTWSSTKAYNVNFVKMPAISILQEFCNDPDNADPLADWLVKAAYPIITSVNMTIKRKAGTSVDVNAITTAIVNLINTQSFVTELPAGAIVSAIQNILPANSYVKLPLALTGTLILPDHTKQVFSGTNALTVPMTDFASITSRTSVFVTDASLINIAQEVQ